MRLLARLLTDKRAAFLSKDFPEFDRAIWGMTVPDHGAGFRIEAPTRT